MAFSQKYRGHVVGSAVPRDVGCAGQVYEYADLAQMAEQAASFRAFIDPDDGDFYEPGDMPTAIRNFCERTHQHVPVNAGSMVRVIYESLALSIATRWSSCAV